MASRNVLNPMNENDNIAFRVAQARVLDGDAGLDDFALCQAPSPNITGTGYLLDGVFLARPVW